MAESLDPKDTSTCPNAVNHQEPEEVTMTVASEEPPCVSASISNPPQETGTSQPITVPPPTSAPDLHPPPAPATEPMAHTPVPDPHLPPALHLESPPALAEHTVQPNPATPLPPSGSSAPYLIILDDAARRAIHNTHTMFNVGRISKTKYQFAWGPIQTLVNFRMNAELTATPLLVQYVSHSATYDFDGWIRQLGKQSSEYLAPSENEPWFASDIIRLNDLLLMQQATTYPAGAPPADSKSPHPESNLIRSLCSLYLPTRTSIINWAKTIALAIQTISDELQVQPPPSIDDTSSPMKANVQLLLWLQSMKTKPPTLQLSIGSQTAETADPPSATQEQNATVLSSSTATPDRLEDMRTLIIDLIISFLFFQANAEDRGPSNPARKKKKKNNGMPSTNVAVCDYTDDQCQVELGKMESRHNFMPFIFYLAAGVRGLFIASRDRRQNSISDCLKFATMVASIYGSSAKPSSPVEPIWNNFALYLKNIMQGMLTTSRNASKFEPPTRHKLARAVADDYINHSHKQKKTPPHPIASAPQGAHLYIQ